MSLVGSIIGAATTAANALHQDKLAADARREAATQRAMEAQKQSRFAASGAPENTSAASVPSIDREPGSGGFVAGSPGARSANSQMGEPGSGPGGSGITYRSAMEYDAARRNSPPLVDPNTKQLGALQNDESQGLSGSDYASIGGSTLGLARDLIRREPAQAIAPNRGAPAAPYTPTAFSYRDAMQRRRY